MAKRTEKPVMSIAAAANGERIPAATAHAQAPHAGAGFRVIRELEHDSVYAVLDDRHIDPDRSVQLDEDRTIDYTADGVPAGVEIKRVSRGASLEGLPEASRIGAELRRLGIAIREAAQAL